MLIVKCCDLKSLKFESTLKGFNYLNKMKIKIIWTEMFLPWKSRLEPQGLSVFCLLFCFGYALNVIETTKLIKINKQVLKIMKFGTQCNLCLPDAVMKLDFLFEFSKMWKKASKVTGCFQKIEILRFMF